MLEVGKVLMAHADDAQDGEIDARGKKDRGNSQADEITEMFYMLVQDASGGRSRSERFRTYTRKAFELKGSFCSITQPA